MHRSKCVYITSACLTECHLLQIRKPELKFPPIVEVACHFGGGSGVDGAKKKYQSIYNTVNSDILFHVDYFLNPLPII